MIKNIFIDLDNTIMDFDRAEKEALTHLLNKYDVKVTDEMINRYHEINKEMWDKLEKKEMKRDQILWRRFDEFFKEYNIHLNSHDFTEKYERELGNYSYLKDGVYEALRDLFGRCFNLYIVTNGTRVLQTKRINAANIKPFFSNIFISQEIGYEKPDVRFFEKAASKIKGFKKEETVIVGDSISSDIQGGKNFGITTIYIGDEECELADYTIPALSEL